MEVTIKTEREDNPPVFEVRTPIPLVCACMLTPRDIQISHTSSWCRRPVQTELKSRNPREQGRRMQCKVRSKASIHAWVVAPRTPAGWSAL